MRRIVFLSGAVSFAMAFLGTLVASTLGLPAVVGAQEARIRAELLTIVGDNGADRITLLTRPGMNAGVYVTDTGGVRRASMNTGGNRQGDAPETAGFILWTADGTSPLAALGTGRRGGEDQPLWNWLSLRAWQGQDRILLRVTEDGTASIQMLDADGNLTWEARDPDHEECESTRMWLGDDFDPEDFDLVTTNRPLLSGYPPTVGPGRPGLHVAN